MKDKRYLGDNIYIRVDDFNRTIITTEQGVEIMHAIILEPVVLTALLKYIQEYKDEVK